MPTPAAQISGLAEKSTAVGPDELKLATTSSEVSRVPIVLNAHVVRTHGAVPGAVMPPHCNWPWEFLPRLPAAATTVMFWSTSALVARVSGSVQNDSYTPAPTDMLTTRMLYFFAFFETQSRAPMMFAIVPTPFSSSTRREMIFVPGAIPSY